jgi:hypothetical protein
MITIDRYTPNNKIAWNNFVETSKNGTFLFNRNYMDYHSTRFKDHSLIIKKNDKIIALFPANIDNETIYSHQGLTYGGIITGTDLKTTEFVEIFDLLLENLSQSEQRKLLYKSAPRIYHQFPAEEDIYALFNHNASLIRSDTLSVIEMRNRLPLHSRRRRGLNKAKKENVKVCESNAWAEFWIILEDRLRETHGAQPIHSLNEILILKKAFPNNIRLFTGEVNKEIIAGTVIYESQSVAHCQYIAATDLGKKIGALDLLFTDLLEDVFTNKTYFDFGISNEEQGRFLNNGLIDFKEGFGARTFVHNFFELLLNKQPKS